MASRLETTSDILYYVEDKMTKTKFRGETQEFLSRSDFDFVTREETIRKVVTKEEWLKDHEKKDFVQEIICDGRKLFVTCIYGNLPLTTLRALLNHGLKDSDFPFTIEACPAPDDTRAFQRNFIQNQKYFAPAFFSLNSKHDLDNGLPKPIDYDESKVLGRGAFGEVVKVQIPETQRDFPSGADRKGQFAMKITQYKGTREESFHQAMANLYHSHLVKCLSSFVYSSKFYMIYEKANCNVEEFMEQHPNPNELLGLGPADFAQQLFGLADGLLFVHNQGRSESGRNSTLLTVPGTTSEKTGYFHDIKPENLLLFVYETDGKKIYWIRLSDFSCAKVVDLVASVSGQHRFSHLSMSKSGTPIYRAPEASVTGKTSRPYDLWSLGCVYLELLVWYLDGYAELTQFRKLRSGLVKPYGTEDAGFYFTLDDSKDACYSVRTAVIEKMKEVSKRCTGPLKDIANTIPRLLQINPELRPTAAQLVESLNHINTNARPPVEIGPPQRQNEHVSSQSSLPVYSSDSDSDFGGLVKVQQPTNE